MKSISKHSYVIRRPLVSEKSMDLLGRVNVAQFVVDRNATKPQIKRAIEELFSVRVKKVRVANYIGKPKRYQNRLGRRSDYKKAFVQLFPGEKLTILEQVSQG